jgi:hypothetical protein
VPWRQSCDIATVLLYTGDVFLCHGDSPVALAQPSRALNAFYVVLCSNEQALKVGASDVLGRCLYWGDVFLMLGIFCVQLLVWGTYWADCQGGTGHVKGC